MSEWKPGDTDRRSGSGDIAWVKKGLFAVVIALLSHFGAGIWWAAVVTTKLDFVQSSVLNLKMEMKDGTSDRYRSSEAEKDFRVINQRMDRYEDRLINLERNPGTKTQ